MNRVLALVPQPPRAETFDARRQAMLAAWSDALAELTPQERADEIDATLNAMRMLSALHV